MLRKTIFRIMMSKIIIELLLISHRDYNSRLGNTIFDWQNETLA